MKERGKDRERMEKRRGERRKERGGDNKVLLLK